MQLTTLLTGLAATALTMGSTTVSAAPANSNTKRVPTLGGFRLSTSGTCPMEYSPNETLEFYTVNFGEACGKCTVPKKQYPSSANETAEFDARTISDAFLNPKCQITLYQTNDCSDAGVVSGSGCWAPEGGIKAYKVSCPWWEEGAQGWQVPCYDN